MTSEPRCFLDTNIFVYAHDRSEPEKQRRARGILLDLSRLKVGAISTQMLLEFYNAVTRRLPARLSAQDAYEQAQIAAVSWPVLPITQAVVLEAIRGARAHGLSILDAQIWATARLNQLSLVFSEDLAGATIEGVRFVDPLAEEFALGDYLVP